MADLRFKGRVAIITGAGRGLGRAHALYLAARGAFVVVNDYGTSTDGLASADLGPASDVVGEIVSRGGQAIADGHSVAVEDGAHALVSKALERFGRIDTLINNAGILVTKPFPETTADEVRRVMDVHFFGTLFTSQAAWPHLAKSGGGRIVNMVSPVLFGMANYSAYAAAKGAILGLTRTLADEGRQNGIAVNAVAPIATTRMSAGNVPAAASAAPAHLEASAVSPLVAYLSHEACPANGEVFTAAGGHISRWRLGEIESIAHGPLDIDDIHRSFSKFMVSEPFRAWSNAREASAYHRSRLAT